MPQHYHRPNIRRFLTASATENDLLIFCYDQKLYADLPEDVLVAAVGIKAKVAILIDYLFEHADLEILLAWTQARYPDTYIQYGPYFNEEPIGSYFEPYRGLAAFQEQHARYFFGRDEIAHELTQLVQRQPLVVLIGSSGSGKSSLLAAGLGPRLAQNERLHIAKFRPADDPFQSLAAVLLPLYERELTLTAQAIETRRLATALRDGTFTLSDIADLVRQTHPNTQLLLIADQFEELFTLCSDSSTRFQFLDLLLVPFLIASQDNDFQSNLSTTQLSSDFTSQSSRPPFTILLSLRADFLGQILAYRPAANVFQNNLLMLGPMNPDELRDAIARPAATLDVSFEQGLVDRILADVGLEPGRLPLLEFALTELWERRQGDQLTHAAYNDIGGVAGALTHYANRIFGALTTQEQAQARRIFTQLVQPGAGTEDTRRLANREDLDPNVWPLVQRLANDRLVVTDIDPNGEEKVELVHEALIRDWDDLVGWMRDDREFRAWQERVRNALHQWQDTQQDEGALLRGLALSEAEWWLEERDVDLNEGERIFIRKSRALQKRRRQKATLGMIGAFSGLILLLILMAWQWQRAEGEIDMRSTEIVMRVTAENKALAEANERATAEAKARDAQSASELQSKINVARELKARALVQFNNNAECALALALEGYDQASTVPGLSLYEFEDVIRKALLQTHVRTTFTGHQGIVRSVDWSRDGRWVASGGDDQTVQIWDFASGEVISTLKGHSGAVYAVAWSPIKQRVASGDSGGAIYLWDVDTGERTTTLKENGAAIRAIAWSPDGKLLASASDDGTVHLWDLKRGVSIAKLTGHNDAVYGLAWSPDSLWLASAGFDYQAKVWEVVNFDEVATYYSLSGQVQSVSWRPNTNQLAFATAGSMIQLWDLDNKGQTVTLAGHNATVWDVDWSTDGKQLASVSEDGTIRLWDVDTQDSTAKLTGHSDVVSDISWSPVSPNMASASWDHTVRIWNVNPESTVVLDVPFERIWDVEWSPDGSRLAASVADSAKGFLILLFDAKSYESTPIPGNHSTSIIRIAWSPDGQHIASASADHTINIHDLREDNEIITLQGHSEPVYDVVWSPGGKELASAALDNTILLWNAETGEKIAAFSGHTDVINGLDWSADGQWLASASSDNTVRVWDAETGKSRLTLNEHISPVASVAWRPDGKLIASGATNGAIIISDAETGERISVLTGHTAVVQDLDWDSGGTRLASASNDGVVRLWDVVTGETIATLTGHVGGVRAVTWRPNGRQVASVGRLDQTIQIHYANFEQDVLPMARTQFERGLTSEEYVTCLRNP